MSRNPCSEHTHLPDNDETESAHKGFFRATGDRILVALYKWYWEPFVMLAGEEVIQSRNPYTVEEEETDEQK